jgi:hypothetical protein
LGKSARKPREFDVGFRGFHDGFPVHSSRSSHFGTGMIILRILKQNRGSEMILPLFMYPPVSNQGWKIPYF